MTQVVQAPEIVHALMVSLRDHLRRMLITDVPMQFTQMLSYVDTDGSPRVMLPWDVKIGRVYDPIDYDEEPVTPAIVVSIHTNDPSDLGNGWKHTIASDTAENLGMHLDGVYEIGHGGATTWWRRFTVFYDCYYMDSDQIQDDASRLTNGLRGAIERCCSVRTPSNPHGWEMCIVDNLGERSLRAEVAKSHYWEGGGPDSPTTGDFIWRGVTWLQVLTVRESR